MDYLYIRHWICKEKWIIFTYRPLKVLQNSIMQNFITAPDKVTIDGLINKALTYKANPLMHDTLGKGKRIGCIFMNPSIRTRLSTQIAAKNLGMDVYVINAGGEGWALEFGDGAIMNGSTVEHIKDAARVFAEYFDVLAIRAFPNFKNKEEDYSEHIIHQVIKYSGLPVISLESATLHPLQSLADLITMTEIHKEARKPKVVLTWAPHIKSIPHCVGNSFAQWVNTWGEADFTITHPEGYELDEKYTSGATITHNQAEALKDADFIYVKNWSSYKEYGQVLCEDQSWMLTLESIKNSNNGKVMHCLPVRRNVELSDEVLDSNQCLVAQQAGNRVWSAQAVISSILLQ
jgi:N-succinyl-L-ornithine transcarbamylase